MKFRWKRALKVLALVVATYVTTGYVDTTILVKEGVLPPVDNTMLA